MVRYFGNETDLVLPETFNGSQYDIYKRVLDETNSVNSLTLASCNQRIEEYAFFMALSLTFIEMPSKVINLKYVGDYAFKETNITSIVIHQTVEYIGTYAFPSTLVSAQFFNSSNWYYNRWGSSGTSVADDLISSSNAAKFLLENEKYYFFTK